MTPKTEYRVEATIGTIYPYRVMPPIGNRSVCSCLNRADADRIARALQLLDAQEQGQKQKWCNAPSPVGRNYEGQPFVCTLVANHDGDHVAEDIYGQTMERWPNQGQAAPLCDCGPDECNDTRTGTACRRDVRQMFPLRRCPVPCCGQDIYEGSK